MEDFVLDPRGLTHSIQSPCLRNRVVKAHQAWMEYEMGLSCHFLTLRHFSVLEPMEVDVVLFNPSAVIEAFFRVVKAVIGLYYDYKGS